ncbi:PASTA domain-containing protein [Actinomycetospora sp. OC33-EN08]|uniref:PASTA domain-containing protein n=1 Tax=Actinomycetospora aurantiaca TaxID=3129233 RepID=A0ABU8MZ35_9PSEU
MVLLVTMLAAAGRPAVTPAAGSSPYPPLPMTPSGGYTVGEAQYAGTVAMPNYVGWTLQAAINDLSTRGIYVGTATPGRETATIIGQNPYPGTRIRQANANIVQLMIPDDARTTTTTTPPPSSTTTTPPPPASDTDVDIDVDTDDHNLPDGALTGGYCRRKWWC